MYPGRILVPMDEAIARDRLATWRSAPIFQAPMTEAAVMPRLKDYVTVEDLDEQAVPPSTDGADQISPVEKHQQIGLDACKRMLHAFFSDFHPPPRSIVVIVDLSVRTAELAKAFLSLSLGVPVYYLGLCEDEVRREWAEAHTLHTAQEMIQNGSLEFPDFKLPPPPRRCLRTSAGEPPPVPQLNVLLANAKEGRRPGPQDVPGAAGGTSQVEGSPEVWAGVRGPRGEGPAAQGSGAREEQPGELAAGPVGDRSRRSSRARGSAPGCPCRSRPSWS